MEANQMSPPTKKITIFLGATGRSRTGCLACRARRKKCDEKKPQCLACVGRGIQCAYTAKPPPAGGTLLPKKEGEPSNAVVKVEPVQTLNIPQSPASVEGLHIHHFRTQLLELISFSSTRDYEDPFLTLILPMTSASPLVRAAVEAAASAHRHTVGTASGSEPIKLQSKALQQLSGALANPDATSNTMLKEEIAAASLMLMYYEVVLGVNIQATRWHLNGAKALLDNLQAASHQSPRFHFLQKLFAFFDVMIAFSLRQPPLGSADILTYGALLTDASDPSFAPDPMFGLAGTLHPLLHALACLLADKAGGATVDDSASILEQKLLDWFPPIPSQKASAELFADFERLLQTAFAHRSAALLVLYSDIVPDRTILAEGYYKSLFDSLLRVHSLASSSGKEDSSPFSTILWPLHTAAMRAQTLSDRVILQRIFTKVNEKHHMKLVEVAGQHARDYWENRATFEAGSVMYG